MRRPFRFAYTALILSASLLAASAVQAMEIRQFDEMAGQDQDEYIAELVQGAEKVLTGDGKLDLAGQVSHLFTTNAPDGNISIGIGQFYLDLAKARLADAERAARDPSAHRLEVEDAMLVTLKKNNIHLSQDFIKAFRAINKVFQPKLPSK